MFSHDQPQRWAKIAAWTALAMCFTLPLPAQAQDVQIVFTPDTPILRDNYESWSLFLVCNQAWLVPSSRDRLINLYEQFQGFGRAIGERHLAVWFWNDTPQWDAPNLSDYVDVERSVEYCDALSLTPSASPHVLVTADFPELPDPGEGIEPDSILPRRFVIELGEAEPDSMSVFLGRLADSLILKGVPEEDPDSFDYAIRLAEAIGGAIIGIGERVKAMIKWGPFSIEIAGSAREEGE